MNQLFVILYFWMNFYIILYTLNCCLRFAHTKKKIVTYFFIIKKVSKLIEIRCLTCVHEFVDIVSYTYSFFFYLIKLRFWHKINGLSSQYVLIINEWEVKPSQHYVFSNGVKDKNMRVGTWEKERRVSFRVEKGQDKKKN